MAIEPIEVLVTSDDYLTSKAKVTRVEVSRLFDDETFEYDENTAVRVWSEYTYLRNSDGALVTDQQFVEYLIEGGNDVPQNVVAYHAAAVDSAIYASGAGQLGIFYPTEPELPTEPA
jgi:hypothetical protein